jgi:hypothetical protein
VVVFVSRTITSDEHGHEDYARTAGRTS